MKRLAVFAHYDAEGEVKDYILHHLAQLRPLCERIVFVSTAALDDEAKGRAGELCDEVRLQPNVGLDFGMWKPVIEETDLSDYDELLICNSSVFGPLWPIEPIMDRMSDRPCDFWGMTENHEPAWHLQSYFLVFKKRALNSQAFADFWASVLAYRDKFQVIRSFEVGLSSYLVDHGLVGEAAFPWEHLFPDNPLTAALLVYKNDNPTCYYPARLLDRGMPFVKTELLRDNPIGVPLGPVWRRIRESGYDEDFIVFDRPPTRRPRFKHLWFTFLQKPAGAFFDRLSGGRT